MRSRKVAHAVALDFLQTQGILESQIPLKRPNGGRHSPTAGRPHVIPAPFQVAVPVG